jgi:hypothetical protein
MKRAQRFVLFTMYLALAEVSILCWFLAYSDGPSSHPFGFPALLFWPAVFGIAWAVLCWTAQPPRWLTDWWELLAAAVLLACCMALRGN